MPITTAPDAICDRTKELKAFFSALEESDAKMLAKIEAADPKFNCNVETFCKHYPHEAVRYANRRPHLAKAFFIRNPKFCFTFACKNRQVSVGIARNFFLTVWNARKEATSEQVCELRSTLWKLSAASLLPAVLLSGTIAAVSFSGLMVLVRFFGETVYNVLSMKSVDLDEIRPYVALLSVLIGLGTGILFRMPWRRATTAAYIFRCPPREAHRLCYWDLRREAIELLKVAGLCAAVYVFARFIPPHWYVWRIRLPGWVIQHGYRFWTSWEAILLPFLVLYLPRLWTYFSGGKKQRVRFNPNARVWDVLTQTGWSTRAFGGRYEDIAQLQLVQELRRASWHETPRVRHVFVLYFCAKHGETDLLPIQEFRLRENESIEELCISVSNWLRDGLKIENQLATDITRDATADVETETVLAGKESAPVPVAAVVEPSHEPQVSTPINGVGAMGPLE